MFDLTDQLKRVKTMSTEYGCRKNSIHMFLKWATIQRHMLTPHYKNTKETSYEVCNVHDTKLELIKG